MTADITYKPLGLLAIGLLAAGLAFVVFKWSKSRHFTFSQHVAERKVSIVYYIALFAITLPLLMAFFVRWFIPIFHISGWFLLLASISSSTQIICTFIPETGGRQSEWHQLFAGVSGVALLPALSSLLFSPSIKSVDKVVAVCCLGIMLAIVGLMALYKGAPRNLLILQSLYFAAFFAPILVITYI